MGQIQTFCETSRLVAETTLCEAHHLAHHAGTLVIARVHGALTFRREGRNSFTRATREVDTKKALHARGFDRERVQKIMARTVTHVGTSDLSAVDHDRAALRGEDSDVSDRY